MTLGGSTISLEFAPLTKCIKISNLPQDISSDDIKFKFANPKTGGGKVTDMVLDKNSGVASVYFEKSSGRKMIYRFTIITEGLAFFYSIVFTTKPRIDTICSVYIEARLGGEDSGLRENKPKFSCVSCHSNQPLFSHVYFFSCF